MGSDERKAYFRQRRKDALAAKICTSCYKASARPGMTTCQRCADRSRERERRPRATRRRAGPRSKSIATKQLTRAALAVEAIGSAERAELEAARPKTRGDCQGAARPCPFVGCKHHLYLDVNPETGTIKINYPDVEPWDLAETCALDIADRGAVVLDAVGGILNITRERARQVEVSGLFKLQGAARRMTGR